MISEVEVQRALDWLIANADKAALARANRIYIEESLKPLRATLMKLSPETAIGAQERDAYADPKYVAQLEGLRAAVEDDERFRWLQKTAEAKIECWRTASSNARAQGKVG